MKSPRTKATQMFRANTDRARDVPCAKGQLSVTFAHGLSRRCNVHVPPMRLGGRSACPFGNRPECSKPRNLLRSRWHSYIVRGASQEGKSALLERRPLRQNNKSLRPAVTSKVPQNADCRDATPKVYLA